MRISHSSQQFILRKKRVKKPIRRSAWISVSFTPHFSEVLHDGTYETNRFNGLSAR
jgi:hypothetical protein